MLKAALFDLDGTLLDSMSVWETVDRAFFARRGMEVPCDYPAAISGMSYMATAEYTKRRFGLAESPAEIAGEWTEIAREEYALRVPLKPGSLEYLSALKDRGVRLAVVTALHRDLYEPCLARNGILNMFDFCLTTDEAGGGSKRDGRLYAKAAERLNAAPNECAVFEDVREGIIGAKAAGMRAYCVIDPRSTVSPETISDIADGWGRVITEIEL